MTIDLSGPSTFVVLAGGALGARILRVAQEHAAFDPARRSVVAVQGPPRSDVAAAVASADGTIYAVLDARQAVTEAWVEDAFVRGNRITIDPASPPHPLPATRTSPDTRTARSRSA